MTWDALIKKFLSMVAVIKSLNPAYKQPGDGSNGVCDCIGLIIGAIRRMGLKWTGIHGSNYAARYQVVNLQKITALSDLQMGDVMLKAYEKGHAKWDLPSRYWAGKQYYNGDLKDYYHAGTITSLSPVTITHMTSPRMKTLTIKSMSDLIKYNWLYHGKAKPIVEAAGGTASIPSLPPATTPSTGSMAVVVANSGGTVNMRAKASTAGKVIMRVPLGTTVEIIAPGEKWAEIRNGNRTGFMMAEFLDVIGDGKGKY